MSHPAIDDRDWSTLTVGERIRQIEVEGYLLLPDLLSPDEIAALKTQTSTFQTTPVDYSVTSVAGQTSSSSGARSPS